jgi:iron complex outermembrane receptor protein
MGGNGPSPRRLWTMYTGSANDDWSETDLGGLLRLQHGRGAWRLFAGLSRTVRAADATERFLAANSPMPAKRWIGNPGLDPARYHQLDLGAGWSAGGSRVDLTLFAADVDGYILRDRAHGQQGIEPNDNAAVYRNVDARRAGVEIDGLVRVGERLVLSGDLAWVWAQNTTDDRPIAQTPPLAGRLNAGWSRAAWSVSGTIRWAADQDRVDDDPTTGSGLDAGPTPGWVTLDLSAGVDLGPGFGLSAGVTNVLDRRYANHLNRASPFDPASVRVNEPGRTFWVRLHWRRDG